MASSSVSQDDIDNDFEKNSRRSRIRTARARQINPSGGGGCRLEIEASPDLDAGHVDELGAAGGVDETTLEHETSPKPMVRSGKDKRPNKLHHGNKGKQQRDRRKLREKRRSTGVVHLASTESTGGSTTGDEEEVEVPNQQQQQQSVSVTLETRKNTQQNESIANSYRQAQEKLGWASNNDSLSDLSNNGSLYPPPNSARSNHRRDKSPSDLEADDENDHDSLNQSETGSNSNLSLGNSNNTLVLHAAAERHRSSNLTNSSTPVVRPTTPTADAGTEDVSRVLEENRRLQSLMEEKDRRIHLLEYKVQQLMKDTLTISAEQSRLQKENSTLLRALSTLTAKEKK